MDQETQIRPREASQFSLFQLLTWITLFSLVVSSLTLLPTLNAGQANSTPSVIRPGLTWVVLLGVHIWRREFLTLVVHTAPVFLILVLALSLQIESNSAVGLLVGMAICSSFVSFLFTIASLARRAIPARTNFAAKFTSHIALGAIVSAIIFGAFPSLTYGRIYMPAVIPGGTIGAWAGLYQAFATTASVRGTKIFGVSLRYVVLAGLIGAIVLPIANGLWLKPNGAHIVDTKFIPIAGLLTAATAFLGLGIASARSHVD